MEKIAANKRRRIKSPPSLNTKKLKGYTLTSRSKPTTPARKKSSLIEAKVSGVSMWPLIRNDYTVFYQAVPADRLDPGQIIVFQSKDRKQRPLVKVHRFLGRVGPFLLEAGDNTFQGSLLEEKNLLGRVEVVLDQKGKKLSLSNHQVLGARQKAFLQIAHGFMYLHEAKDRLVGHRKSLILWKLSQLYRGGLRVVGLEVPPIFPR